ncbi:MAG TPA: transporter substrate-binding domain-containing protein [Thermoleophilia bacterium]|nr:transporter substrate-binding domain-containing protein [Thermoleophilia bacterium]
MRQRKWAPLAALVLVAILGLVLVAGCGSSTSNSTSSTAPNASPTTPTESFTKILGHAPTGQAATIAERGHMVVVDDANYPPQSSINKQGVLVGFDVDVAKQVGVALGIPVKIITANWDSIPTGLNVDRFDVSIGSMTITKQREKALSFSDPYYYTQGQVIVKNGSPMLTSLKAMKGKNIGVGTQTTYYYYLNKSGGINVKAYDTDASTFPDLKNGRLDGVMTADLTAAQSITSGYPFVFSGKPYYYEPLAFATKKGETDWVALLDYAVKTMHENGTLTTMAKKWYHGFDPTQPPAAGTPTFDQAMAQLGK